MELLDEIAEEGYQESAMNGAKDKDEIPRAAASEGDEIVSGYCFDIFLINDLIKLHESNGEYLIIAKAFFAGMEENLSKKIKIVAINKIPHSTLPAKARAENFQILKKAVAGKCGGDANVKYACVLSSKVDDTGLRHLLLCRVILGKQEVVTGDCNVQLHPSSPEFNSGVDDLSTPRKYIIWSPSINSHILPCYIISFEAQVKGLADGGTLNPRWLGFDTLMPMLSRCLGSSEMASLEKYYKDFQEKKITKAQLVERIREIAGRQLLSTIFNQYTNKELQGCSGGK
ncbi:hypothetical protein F3Y22_tig00110893pilonHSYRG00558 [Hibiscus syriacus]|uniref:RST domain-containing protein n=1 Tax=Hibiscus syriacus TaxID=106335 RepID=A0A6A2ZI45_HIBSY|nr:hypothetical protein F3Y22_tig00110893pilonHSYRG00558 [Hibiscus syriacus]